MGVKQLQEKVDAWHLLRNEKAALETQVAKIQEKLNPLTAELVKILETMDLKRFDGTLGRVNLVTINYVNSPKGETEKKAFFDHLKAEGIFEDMASVHHKTINSYFNEKYERAVAEGTELNIPGLEVQQRVELRKGK